MKLLSRTLIAASIFALVAVPASAVDVTIKCPHGADIIYEPYRTSTGDVSFLLDPTIVGATCTPSNGVQHILSGAAFGVAANPAFTSVTEIKAFLDAMNRQIDARVRKKIVEVGTPKR